MKSNFKTENCNVEFDMEKMTFKNLSEEKSKSVKCSSKSKMFEMMYDAGMEICEISKQTESHYSFVYGVISNNREVRKVVKETKSGKIRQLTDEGKKPGEIAKLLNSNYSFVFGVVKKYKNSEDYKKNHVEKKEEEKKEA